MSSVVAKIISGGQTGVDRAGLALAVDYGLPHGGWCPAGRRAEDGCIPEEFDLQETESRSYRDRTERNVETADITLILIQDGHLTPGSKICLLYTSPSPRDGLLSRMPSSA